MKKEDVRKGLECCQVSMSDEDPFSKCEECPYNDISVCVQECRSRLSKDALEVIKGQEPLPPIIRHEVTHYERFDMHQNMAYCAVCGCMFLNPVNYCPKCGRPVKWNDG